MTAIKAWNLVHITEIGNISNDEHIYYCKTRIGFLIKYCYALIFYDYVEVYHVSSKKNRNFN